MTNNPKNPLAERLRAARKQRMTQQQLADLLSWAPSKISKIESGRQLPSAADITAWAEQLEVGDAVEQAWLSMLDQAEAEHKLWTEQLRAGQAAVQMDFQELVQSHTVFRFYEKAYIPLFHQTPAYARANLAHIKSIYQPEVNLDSPAGQLDHEHAVTSRLTSAARLFDPACRFEFILDEAVLRTWRYSTDIWRDQLIRLATTADLSNTRFGILPQNRLITVFNTNSFEMYGDVVSVETSGKEYRIVDDQQVKHYRKKMDDLWAEAVTGPEVIRIIDDARRAIPR